MQERKSRVPERSDRPDGLAARYRRLEEILRGCGSVCIGYSGGVDSVFLACVAVDVLGPERVLAVTGRSAAYPRVQREMALECVRRFGIPHLEIATDELEDPSYAANPPDRCYFCKTELWGKLAGVARERDLAVVVDGSNADDAGEYRPGLRAGGERGVRSPLLEAGLGKADIRHLSRERGLPTWDQPAAPCLASRLPYGVAVTPARLQQVEAAEDALRAAGFREVRVRHHAGIARIEVAPEEVGRLLELGPALGAKLRGLGFGRVLVDVEGYRRGALNEGLSPALPAGARGSPARAELALDVDAVGPDGAIAAVRAGTLEAARAAAPDVRRLGFSYVALDLEGSAPGAGRV